MMLWLSRRDPDNSYFSPPEIISRSMRVGINARVLAKPKPAGVGKYTEQLLTALATEADENKYFIFGVDSLPPAVGQHENIIPVGEFPDVPNGPRGHLWEQVSLPRALKQYDIDVLHSTAGFSPLFADVPTVITVHDISPIIHPEWFSHEYAFLYRTLTPLVLQRVDHVITISEFSKTEISNRYPEIGTKISAIRNGLNTIPEEPSKPIEGLESHNFFLFFGAIDPRKNIARIIDGYRSYRERNVDPLPLIFAGPSRDVASAVDQPTTEGVRTLGYVSDAERNWLYHHATALVFPSLYEGFGLPILEAMSAGTPVITSNCGAMTEVADDAALLVDPYSPTAIAEGMKRIATEEDLKSRLISAGRERVALFSWESTATQTAKVYHQVTMTDV